jgi:hypothetical protein
MDFFLLWVFVLSGRGLCDGQIPRPEESYRLWCVSECDQVKIQTLHTYCKQVGRRGKDCETKRNETLQPTTCRSAIDFPCKPHVFRKTVSKVLTREVKWRKSRCGDEASKSGVKWSAVWSQVKWRSCVECVYYHWFIVMQFVSELLYCMLSYCFVFLMYTVVSFLFVCSVRTTATGWKSNCS